jgi:hypothetical protein
MKVTSPYVPAAPCRGRAPARGRPDTTAVFDAATFVTLDAGLRNQPPQVSPQTLGHVLNLRQASK